MRYAKKKIVQGDGGETLLLDECGQLEPPVF